MILDYKTFYSSFVVNEIKKLPKFLFLYHYNINDKISFDDLVYTKDGYETTQIWKIYDGMYVKFMLEKTPLR